MENKPRIELSKSVHGTTDVVILTYEIKFWNNVKHFLRQFKV